MRRHEHHQSRRFFTLNIGTHIQSTSNAHFYIDDCTMSMTKTKRIVNVYEEKILEERTNRIMSTSEIQVYPNPFQENFTLNFELPKAGKVSIHLVDMMGKVVHQVYQETYLENGLYQELVELSNLNAGLYQLVVQTEERAFVRTIVQAK